MLALIEQKELLWGLVVLAGTLMGLALGWKHLTEKKENPRQVPVSTPVPSPLIIRAEVDYLPIPEFKEHQEYVHEEFHRIRNILGDQNLLIECRREENMAQIQKLADTIKGDFLAVEARRSVGVANLHGQLKGAEIKLAAVDSTVVSIQRAVDTQGGKIDRMADRIADKIQEVISNNQRGN